MSKRKKAASKPKKPLDMYSQKRGRGRPGIRSSEVFGRAYNHRLIFNQIWDSVGPPLLAAQTEEEVVKAFDARPGYQREFATIANVILKVLRDPKFPKRRQAQINFIADSTAGWGWISPRRSRDICDRERAKERRKSRHRIIRQEYYVECSCGYKGPARDNACRECGAEIPPSLFATTGFLNGL